MPTLPPLDPSTPNFEALVEARLIEWEEEDGTLLQLWQELGPHTQD